MSYTPPTIKSSLLALREDLRQRKLCRRLGSDGIGGR